MPDNSIFEGEDAILAWISDDENKIPLKVEAEMFIGHAGIFSDPDPIFLYHLQSPCVFTFQII